MLHCHSVLHYPLQHHISTVTMHFNGPHKLDHECLCIWPTIGPWLYNDHDQGHKKQIESGDATDQSRLPTPF